MNSLLGKLIAGRYRIDSVVGSGGVGTVYRAMQEPLHRPVALKMLRPELSENAEVRRRFVREARAVAALSHPNIAMVHDFGAADEHGLYLALEFVEGTSLADMLESRPSTYGEIRVIFDQLLAGLAHAHARGVIHRDIKPGNVLIATDQDGQPQVKIVDFGIATVRGFDWSDDADTTGSGHVVGTPHFMAPEQARGERHLTATVDVYTVGLMLYWAITGEHAFDGAKPMDIMMAQVSMPPPPVRPRQGLHVPEGMEALIHKALAKSPAERIPSASAFRSRLKALSGGTTMDTSGAGLPSRRRGATTNVRPPTMLEGGSRTMLEEAIEETGDPPVTQRHDPSTALRSPPGIVGHADDRKRLLELMTRALSTKRGLILTIEGEAGYGKSTLARWLVNEVTLSLPVAAAYGAFHREGERGLRGLRDAFEYLLDTRGLDHARVAHRVASLMGEWGMTEPQEASLLIRFLRPAIDDTQSASRESTGQLFELLVRVWEHASSSTPIVVTLDDVQWAGRDTAAFLEYAATEFTHREASVVVIATIQLNDVDDRAIEEVTRQLSRYQSSTVHRHQLRRLNATEARRLVHAIVDASAELTQAIVERASGNPMHVVQLVRYLAEERLIEPAPGGWRAIAGVRVEEVLPPGLADIVLLRVEQLESHPHHGERIRLLLDRCAILGRAFRFGVLERMLQIENRGELLEHIDEDIDRLLDEELLAMRETRVDDILSFPTSLVRDVVLERLKNRRTTRRLHMYAAEAKLAIQGADSDKIAADLAAHFAAARDLVRQFKYTRIAAEVAENSHRPYDAVAYFEEALSLVDHLGDDLDDVRRQTWRIHLRLGGLSTGIGEYEAAIRYYESVRAANDVEPESRVRATFGLSDVAWIRGRFEQAAELLHEGIGEARELSSTARLSEGLVGLARVEWHRGQVAEADRLVGEALTYARAAGDGLQVAEALWLMGDLARGRGDIPEAETLFRQAMDRYRTLDQPRGIAKCYAKLAVLARLRADLDRAQEHYRSALDLYTRLGGRRGVAHQLNGLGDVARYRHDYDLATENYRRAVDIFQSLELPFDAAISLTNLGLVARESGNLEEAEDALRRALSVSEFVGFPYLSLGVKLNLALVLAQQEKHDESNALLDESLKLADEVDLVDPDYALPLEELGVLKAQVGRSREADVLYERARSMWRELGRDKDFKRVEDRLRPQE